MLRFFAIRALARDFEANPQSIARAHTHKYLQHRDPPILQLEQSQNKAGELRIECGAAVQDFCTFCHLRPTQENWVGKEKRLWRDRRRKQVLFFGIGSWRDREWQCRSFQGAVGAPGSRGRWLAWGPSPRWIWLWRPRKTFGGTRCVQFNPSLHFFTNRHIRTYTHTHIYGWISRNMLWWRKGGGASSMAICLS